MTCLKEGSSFFNYYTLAIVTIGYVLGELGHYLIGVTSKQTAMDLHYGDKSCQMSTSDEIESIFEVPGNATCKAFGNSTSCDGVESCEWTWNGLGLDYQLLAGPSFIAIFTIFGVILGFMADKYNRKATLTICTFIFGAACFAQGSVKTYWQLIILRMVMAAGESGCNPLAQGILSDIFPEDKRALVMAIFNWGIYGGYGLAFPVGRYITKANIMNLGWRACYYIAGICTLIIGVVTGLTLKEPPRKAIGNENDKGNQPEETLWKVMIHPRMLLLMLAASLRHCGGMTFAYNADLYYNTYFPEVDLGWWLFALTIGIGSIGVVVGGVVSDKIVAKMGIRSRGYVLALSQLLSTIPAFGSVYYEPKWAMTTLALSYFFAEMWFGILFAIVVEIVPLKMRSSVIGIFLFVMNNIGGNLPIAVDPVSKILGYRAALMIFYAGMYGISSILFLITCIFLESGKKEKTETTGNIAENAYQNSGFTNDEGVPKVIYTPRMFVPQDLDKESIRL
ncbi:hypothetical protein ACFFRR_002900 [Megaselia abdita]